MSVTYKKKAKKRVRKHGFLKRMSTKKGAKIVSRRRAKKRKVVAVAKKRAVSKKSRK